MALRGNLRDFSLPDVFQLITFSRKTGVLRIVRSDEATGSVWFRDGDVFFASSNWHSQPLGMRLVEAHRITPQALTRALEIRADEGADGRRLGTILVDEGYITRDVLETFVQDQIQDGIFDLMRWDEGDFDFEAMPEVVEEDIGLTVSIENVVMEGSRRLEEWSRIKRKIPSMDIVFKMATAPGEGTFEISLKPLEWQLLLLIDSTRSVSDLARETRHTDFEVARVVYGLFSAGLLEFATDAEIEHHRAERAQREERLAVIEAERALHEREEQEAAQAREAALAQEALRRREAEQAAQPPASVEESPEPESEAEPGTEPAPEPETEPAVRRVAEVPSFLGAQAPSASDEAVLDQFMGALLGESQETPQVADEPEPPSAAHHVPAEMPAFMGAAPISFDESTTVANVADMLGMDAEAKPLPIVGVELSEEPPTGPIAEMADTEPVEPPQQVPATPVVQPVEVEPEVTLSGWEQFAEPDTNVDAGPAEPEMPSQPVEAEPFVLQPFAQVDSAPEVAPVLSELPTEEPTPLLEEVDAQSFEFSLLNEQPAPQLPPDELALQPEPIEPETENPMSAVTIAPVPDAMPVAEPRGIEEAAPSTATGDTEQVPPRDFAADLMALGLGEIDAPTTPEAPQVAASAQGVDDLAGLIASLDGDSDAVVDVEEPANADDFDVSLLEEPAATPGVISTDSFLADIGIEDLGLSGGLTDEISALTGAERKSPTHRPRASVNSIDDAGPQLRRDTRVDKDTLLKIIDGIKGL